MPEQARLRQPAPPSQVVGGFVHVRVPTRSVQIYTLSTVHPELGGVDCDLTVEDDVFPLDRADVPDEFGVEREVGHGGDPGALLGLPVDGVIARFMRRITPRADLADWNTSMAHPPSLNRCFTPPALLRTSSVGTSVSEFATASRSQVTVGRTVGYRNAKASFRFFE